MWMPPHAAITHSNIWPRCDLNLTPRPLKSNQFICTLTDSISKSLLKFCPLGSKISCSDGRTRLSVRGAEAWKEAWLVWQSGAVLPQKFWGLGALPRQPLHHRVHFFCSPKPKKYELHIGLHFPGSFWIWGGGKCGTAPVDNVSELNNHLTSCCNLNSLMWRFLSSSLGLSAITSAWLTCKL